MKRNSGGTIVPLQGLRGIAAILVVCDHAILTLSAKANRFIDSQFAWHLGELGVAIFFVISGAVMVMGHYNDFGKPNATKSFIRKRLIRIIPLYWITSSIYAFKLAFQGNLNFSDFCLSLFFIPHASTDRVFGRPIYELGWTLQYELFFYAFFALALCVERRRGLILLLCGMVTLVCLQEWMSFPLNSLTYFIQPIILYFVVGVTLGLIRNFLIMRLSQESLLSSNIAICLTGFIVIVELITYNKAIWFKDISLAFCAILAVGLCMMVPTQNSQSWIAKVCIILGDITYALYLTHSFVLGPSGRLVAYYPNISTLVFVAIMVIVTVLFAYLIYLLVEKPLLSKAKRVFTS